MGVGFLGWDGIEDGGARVAGLGLGVEEDGRGSLLATCFGLLEAGVGMRLDADATPRFEEVDAAVLELDMGATLSVLPGRSKLNIGNIVRLLATSAVNP